jgi:hypothetical protein
MIIQLGAITAEIIAAQLFYRLLFNKILKEANIVSEDDVDFWQSLMRIFGLIFQTASGPGLVRAGDQFIVSL